MASKTILLKGDPLRKEYVCAAAITPGWLCSLDSNGKAAKHASAGQTAQKMFAIEDSLQGNEIGDDYSSGDRGQFISCRPGDEVYAWLKQGESVNPSDYLESAGDGTLQKYSASSAGAVEYPSSIVGKPLETLDLSTSGDTATRIKIEVM